MTEDISFSVALPCDAERISWPQGHENTDITREHNTFLVAEEAPLALVYNGIDYAVMMITPHDIDDFVAGFSFTEDIISSVSDLRHIKITAQPDGLRADVRVNAQALRKVLARTRRPIAGRTGCGICGADMESVTNRKICSVTGREPDAGAIHKALENLRSHQVLNKGVGMLHAAAWCLPNGHIVHVREDVGRHNALDKLIGYGLKHQLDFTQGFCFLTSRCSYEMAAKAIAAGMSAVVSLSAPTALAVRTARAAGLVLISPARTTGMYMVSPAPQN
ncbi:sulfurtransferase FdhD [Acetobacter pasteurianus]|uniref:Sulfur carrier protein FdhD n=2 Tax=Acetobacter pasteurianus TaxID=438 RepID=C7JI15_ACEP3|nr:formate dehydrogenase accessory sulfurtransferase FdhD [Acetobacter pasteurianus]ASC06789.1 Protein FdhD like protein [Acetobacter pasteurianus subsp. pasteurianus]CCT58463.1 Formate dehydrogenase, subunit FdhD [Acetobacter pasteurianus 386B]BAH99619.1 formate dehydrogenase family accessory protein FdhD [Acetobacter pasteurianus IFO 3283-01]BAI02672.1 formate dehydrogenase family accessory protein FdhD [Acetobacter pasteurianus IFO 3283-03]BAI05718.1 formate dehydrogenase family accessory p